MSAKKFKLKEKKWLVTAAPSDETAGKIKLIATELGINPIIASLLYGRGYTTPVAAKKFLYMETEVLTDPNNMADMARAVEIVGGKAITEASGNMGDKTAEELLAVAKTGVDIISVGSLTHSVHAMDISLKLVMD